MAEALKEAILINVLEQAFIHEQVAEFVCGVLIGQMGARIMGMLDDGDDLEAEDDNEQSWERVKVDIIGYRVIGDPSFQRHFRLSKPTYEILVNTIANYLIDSGKVIRVRNPIDVPLLMVLWILANPDTFRSVALRFGVLPGVVYFHHSYITETLRKMALMYVKWPTEEERNSIKGSFQAYSGFSGIVGVLDGTHNVITAPAIQKERFRNRQHTYSFNTMVVCDDNLLIRDMHIGEVGSLHDQRVFRRSSLFKRLVNDPKQNMLEEDEHTISDSAYACQMNSVMVPFRNSGNLNPEQRHFNYAVCKCRARIENCFEKAFNQWRRMKMLHSYNV